MPHGLVVAELNKPPGLAAQLALPPGRYRVERTTDAAEVDVLASGKTLVEPALFVSSAVAARGGDELDGFASPFSSDVVNALSAGYDSGVQTSQPGAWRHAIDLAYALDAAPYGLLSPEHGIEGGYRWGLGRFFVGLRAGFHNTSFPSASLRRAGALLDGGVRFLPGPVELQPHLGVGVQAVWRTEGPVTRADFTAPHVVLGLRVEVPIGMGLSVLADARGELVLVSLSGVRTPFVSPLVSLGVSWKR
jgi:hypothetical protein